jgi:hypothetical protein
MLYVYLPMERKRQECYTGYTGSASAT